MLARTQDLSDQLDMDMLAEDLQQRRRQMMGWNEQMLQDFTERDNSLSYEEPVIVPNPEHQILEDEIMALQNILKLEQEKT